MGARVTGWAQRRVQNGLAQVAAINAYVSGGANSTTAASSVAFEVTAGNPVTITYGWNDPNNITGIAGATVTGGFIRCDVFYETSQTLWETAATSVHNLTTGNQGNSATFTLTFTPTHTGTVRLFTRLQVLGTAGATLTDINSDAGNFGSAAETLPTGGSSTDFSPGLLRCGCALSSLVITGASTPASYSDSVTATFNTAAAPRTADTSCSLAWQDATPTTFNTDTIAAGTTTALAATRTVDNSWPHASTAVGLLLTPASSALSTANGGAALPWIHFTALPSSPGTVTGTTDAAGNFVTARFAGALTADPRLTKVGLLQVNDNAWGTAPLSKDVALHQRLTADLGFLAMRYRNAAGTGLNGLSVSHTLQDSAALTTAITWSDTTATEGGEAGWTNTLQPWSSSLPGGTWKHTTTVTAPAGATGLESGFDTLTLLARNPNYQVIAGASLATAAAESDHAHPGDSLVFSMIVLNVATDQSIAPDTGTCVVSLIRYNAAANVLEAFNNGTGLWSAWTVGATLPTIALTANPNNANLYQVTLSTATWGTTDIVAAQAQCKINGTPYGADAPRELVSAAANHHSTYALDAVGFALSGKLSFL